MGCVAWTEPVRPPAMPPGLTPEQQRQWREAESRCYQRMADHLRASRRRQDDDGFSLDSAAIGFLFGVMF